MKAGNKVEDETTRKRMDRLLAQLIGENPLYGVILNLLCKNEDNSIPTAGVRAISSTNVELVYNKEFIDKLNDEAVIAVLKHEMFHVLFGHIYMKMSMCVNVAADIAINQHIYPTDKGKIRSVLPECMTHDHPMFKPPMPENLALEEYYALLKQKNMFKELVICGKNLKDILDKISKSHQGWGGKELEGIKAKITEAVKKAIRENSWGNMPGDVVERIKAAYNDEINWRSYIRMFTTSIISIKRKNSRRCWNKKFGDVFPGKQRQKAARILTALDVSGSMSSEDLKICAGSMDNLIDTMGVEVDFCQFDTQVSSYSKKYTKRDSVDIKGRGGTDPQCVFDMIKKKNMDYDGVIIFTDGQFGAINTNGMPRILWVFTPGTFNKDVPGAKTAFKRGMNDIGKDD